MLKILITKNCFEINKIHRAFSVTFLLYKNYFIKNSINYIAD